MPLSPFTLSCSLGRDLYRGTFTAEGTFVSCLILFPQSSLPAVIDHFDFLPPYVRQSFTNQLHLRRENPRHESAERIP